jgi:hypothetical protein
MTTAIARAGPAQLQIVTDNHVGQVVDEGVELSGAREALGFHALDPRDVAGS